MNKTKTVIITILLITAFYTGYHSGTLENNSFIIDASSIQELEEETRLAGFYSEKNFYCVWTRGNKEEIIDRIDEHEVCHSLIHEEYEHFCNDAWENKVKENE